MTFFSLNWTTCVSSLFSHALLFLSFPLFFPLHFPLAEGCCWSSNGGLKSKEAPLFILIRIIQMNIGRRIVSIGASWFIQHIQIMQSHKDVFIHSSAIRFRKYCIEINEIFLFPVMYSIHIFEWIWIIIRITIGAKLAINNTLKHEMIKSLFV